MNMRKFILTGAIALCSSAAYCQSDQLLIKIEHNSFKGESTSPGYEDYIPVHAVNLGVSNPTTTGPGTVGKPSFSDVSIIHDGSKNSPVFSSFAAAGTAIPEVEIVFLKSAGDPHLSVVYKVTLNNVHITSVNTAASDDCSLCAFGVENITLSYTKIKWEDPVSGTKGQWDLTSQSN